MAEQQLARRFRRWFEYEIDVNERVWESLDSVAPEERTGEIYQGILEQFGHMVAARQLWLYRMGALEKAPDSLFPRNITRRELRVLLDETQKKWSHHLERLDDEELARVVSYAALEGGEFENSVEDLLAQLYGHGCYHRGQIASALRRCGGTPASTDFVLWARRPKPGG